MLFLYDLSVRFYYFLILIASVKSVKARQWLSGRKTVWQQLENYQKRSGKSIWFHFASLGEFEQGRPVLEAIKQSRPDKQVVVTFFSPSGYEVRKDYQLADGVFYLPLDTRKNARKFIRIVQPELAIFTKYEYWYHYFSQLRKNNIPLLMIACIFREGQPFFKWYGTLHRLMLSMVSHYFVQDIKSSNLLHSLNIQNVTVAGDTRFDRVTQNTVLAKELSEIREFLSGRKAFIAGSTWTPDEERLAALPAAFPDWKFVIAPHEVNDGRMKDLEGKFEYSIRYSRLGNSEHHHQVLLIDNIGMLSSLYQYGDIAYIGGGFGRGIHNTQEPAAFGLPVIFGPNYTKFREAADLVAENTFITIRTTEELLAAMNTLTQDGEYRKRGAAAREYIFSHAGATERIISFITENKLLS